MLDIPDGRQRSLEAPILSAGVSRGRRRQRGRTRRASGLLQTVGQLKGRHDAESGRIVVTPSVALDGERWSTYVPGDGTALHAGLVALVELLPGRSWFGTSRSD